MPRPKSIAPFFLVVTDRDKGLFNVIGPMSDDTSWNRRVCLAQDQGRAINCHTPGKGRTKEEIIAAASSSLGLRFTEEPLL